MPSLIALDRSDFRGPMSFLQKHMDEIGQTLSGAWNDERYVRESAEDELS